MKLIHCPKCGDVLALLRDQCRYCDCGASWGAYSDDGLHVTVGGKAVVLGVGNESLVRAVRAAQRSNPKTHWIRQPVSVFTAFVIIEPNERIQRE